MNAADLFGVAPPPDPLIGRAICVSDYCGYCGANIALICAGRGPHAAELRCRNCDRHVHWLSHADFKTVAEFFAELESQFGVPSEIIYRLPPSSKQESEMATERKFETKPNSGALFKNADKVKHTDRDYSGELNVEGTEYWVSAWINTSKKGTKYLALTLKPKDAAFGASTQTKPDFNDEIGF